MVNGIVVLMVCIDSVLKGQCRAVFFPVWSSNFCWRILRQVLFCFFVFVIFTLAWIRFWKIYLKLTNSSISHKTSFEHNQCVLFLLIIFQNNVNWWLMVVFFFSSLFWNTKTCVKLISAEILVQFQLLFLHRTCLSYTVHHTGLEPAFKPPCSVLLHSHWNHRTFLNWSVHTISYTWYTVCR